MKMEIKIMKNILAANQNKAEEIKKLLSQKKILMINLIGAPGAVDATKRCVVRTTSLSPLSAVVIR